MSDDLMRRIRLGDDSVLELKSVRIEGRRVEAPDRRALADELAALANGAGGTLILGVDDETREIQGIPLEGLDAVEALVREICNDSLKPAVDADIRKLALAKHSATRKGECRAGSTTPATTTRCGSRTQSTNVATFPNSTAPTNSDRAI
ncbi:MAG: hypothetical protein F4089_03640 [Gammaproteobacteria bacterium]|nr:hypothetical protein [Gammaproteobacteria bacterium]